jgi:hypothetical protein
VRAVEGALFVVVLPVHVLDPMCPLRIRRLVKRCDACDWTPKLDERDESKPVHVRMKILNILWQRDMIWSK